MWLDRFKKKKKKELDIAAEASNFMRERRGQSRLKEDIKEPETDIAAEASNFMRERRGTPKMREDYQPTEEEQKPRAKPVDAMERERSWGKSIKSGFKSLKSEIASGFKPTKPWDEMKFTEKSEATRKEFMKFGFKGTMATGGQAVGVTGGLMDIQRKMNPAYYLLKKAGINTDDPLSRNLREKSNAFLNDEEMRPETFDLSDNPFQNPKLLKNFEYLSYAFGSQVPHFIMAGATGGLSEGLFEAGAAMEERETKAEQAKRESGIKDTMFSLGIGLINGALGKFGFDTVFNKNPAIKKMAQKQITKRLGKYITNRFVKTIINHLAKTGISSGTETSTEYLQEIIPQIAAKVFYDEGGTWKKVIAEGNKQGLAAAGQAMVVSVPTAAISTGGTAVQEPTTQDQGKKPEGQPPKPPEGQPAEVKPKITENINKAFGLLAKDDKEALAELLPKMSQEEILEVRNSLVKMERQGRKDALEDRKMIEDILNKRETKSNETAKKILKEGKLESLEELPLEDRKKVIGVIEKTKDETAVGEITKEREKQVKLKEEKTKLLAERKEKPEQKKEIQAKIDKIDEQRRDEFVAEIAPEAQEGVAKTIKEKKGIKILETKKYEHKQKTTTKPKRISEPRKAGKLEPKKVSDKTAEAREKQQIGRRVEKDGVLIYSLAPDQFALEDKEGTPVMSLGVAETAKTKLEKEFKITIKKVKGRKDSYNVFAEKKEVGVKELKAKKKTYLEDKKKFIASFINSEEGEKAYQAIVKKEARLEAIGETDKTVVSGIKNNPYYRKEKTIKDAMGEGYLLKKGNRYMIAESKDLDRFVKNGWDKVIEIDTLANEAGFASGEDYLNYTLEQFGKEESLPTIEKESHKILMEKDETYKTLNDEINNLTKKIYEKSKEEIGEIADIEKKETKGIPEEKYQKMTARELALNAQYSGQYEYVNKELQRAPFTKGQISSKEATKIFRQFFTKKEMPIEIVEKIVAEDGGEAFGLTAAEMVKFIQNPKRSTPYHEAVHTYLNKYATKKQWQELMSEVKKEKYGEKTEAKITEAELEEDLAEDFIGYVKTRKAPSNNIIKRFYDDVIKFLKKLVGKENKIEAFYETIIEKKRPGYLQKVKLLLGKLREREILYQRKRSKEYVEMLEAMSKRDTKSFEDITEITDKAAFNSYFRKDINWIEDLFAQSRDIYLKDKKEFVAAKMFEDSANDRRMNKSDMDNSVSKLLKPYYDLNKKSQDKLNKVLMHGDMEGKKYNKTELAELGITTKEEITAYYNIRKSFEKVLDTIVEKMREVGVSEDEIADFQRTKIGYMPHKWEHKFVVKEQKQDADGNWQTISMEDFAKKKWSMKVWIERKRQNKREDIRYVPGTLDSIDVDFFTEQRLSFENFKSIIENAKAPEDMKKVVLEAIKNMVKEKGFGRHFIRRTGVEGYDMNRTPVIIADYFSGFSGYITKMEASPKYFEALEKIDPVKQKKFYRWMRNTIAYDMGNAPEYNEIKTLAFTYYLANDISFLATNATQNFTVGIGELSKLSKGGKKVYQPEQKLLAANKDWWTQNISKEEKASVKKLLDEGRLGAEMTGELMGFKNNPLYRSVSRNLNSALFSTTAFVERNVNRVPAFLAARRILESQGITGEELNKQALDKSDDIHFRYGKQHRPMLYRKYGGPIFVFTHYIRSFMFQLSRDVKHREFVSLGRKMFYTSFFGGLTALPFAKLIVETWKEIVGDWDDDDESKEEVSRWETMVKKGVPASFGVDMSGRVSIDIFALENIKDDPKNITKWVGAAGGLIVRGHQGYEMVRQGRYIEASGKLLPDFAGNPFRGYYGYEYGVRSFGGVPLETEDEELFEYSFSEALTKGVGFSPTRETALYEKIREERKKKDKKSKKRKRLKMKIEDAKRRGDYKKRRELKRELRKLE